MKARIFLFGAALMTASFLCGIGYAVEFIGR